MSISIGTFLVIAGLSLTIILAIFKAAWTVSSMLSKLVTQIELLTKTVSDGFKVAESRTESARSEFEDKAVAIHQRIDSLDHRVGAAEGRMEAVVAICKERHGRKAEAN